MSDTLLTLTVKTRSPELTRNQIMKALAASLRWAAHADLTDDDPDNIYQIAQLLEAIVPKEND